MEAIMTSTMSHCWVCKLCAWVCKKCAPCAPYFAHLNAYPHNFMCVYNNGIIVDVIIASQMYYIWASHSQFTCLLDSKDASFPVWSSHARRPVFTNHVQTTWNYFLELFRDRRFTWNSFGWPLTRVSHLSLSIHSGEFIRTLPLWIPAS